MESGVPTNACERVSNGRPELKMGHICFYCGKEENLIEKPEILPLCLEHDAKKDRVRRRCHTSKAKE